MNTTPKEVHKMLIKEVEQLTGIKRKNIRFYEKEGLLNPNRNSENRYRTYTNDDVRRLKEIKLLRKLGVSIVDIKQVQSGELSLNE
jgi:DNA-binding transcriptional MerR regulator